MPGEVIHALDFFIWAALDEAAFPPTELRPFGDDERYYNAILNKHFGWDIPSTAETSVVLQLQLDMVGLPRHGEPEHVPTYFPDAELDVIAAVSKDLRVLNQFQYRNDRLERVASVSSDAEAVRAQMPTSRWVLVNPSAYSGYFRLNREKGLRFADATHERREGVTVIAPMAAVIPQGTDDPSRLLFDTGWKAAEPIIAKRLLPDFLDPESLVSA